MQRKFTPIELNHLRKHGIDPYQLDLESIGEKPVEYLTGFSEFYGRDFVVDESTLIPRIETERMIDIALDFIEDKKINNVSFLDIGTGSGNIGISLALELEKRRIKYDVTLSDISEAALQVTQSNIERLINQASNLKVVKSDLFKNLELKTYNLILTNLPYIPASRKLQESVQSHEPHSALFSGPDGLDHIRRFFDSVGKFLDKDGKAILEVDDTHDSKVAHEFRYGYEIEVFHDLNGKNRFWVAKKR